MTLKLSSAALRAARKAAGRRGSIKAKVKLYATDEAGNVDRATRTVIARPLTPSR